jgi:tetratricopeptide (TPR) repeat protein
LEWDSTLAEAHSALAAVYRDYDWDWAASEREFRQAIALNPADSMAHQWYAELLSEVLGRHDEAIAEIKRAQELDLLSPITNTILGRTLLFAGQVDAAVLQLQTTVDVNPTFAHAHFMLGNAYLEKGLVDKAVKEFSAASTLAPDMPRYASALAYSYARRGDRKQARDLLGKLAAQSAVGHSLWFDRAVIYTGLGERDIALAYLERARADHDPRLRWLPMEPFFESLRSDPRFKNLEDRLSLTAS